jgi:hypothetical protein
MIELGALTARDELFTERVAGWLSQRDICWGGTTLGHWLVTDSRVIEVVAPPDAAPIISSPLETVADAFLIAIGATHDAYEVNFDNFALFTCLREYDDGEVCDDPFEIEWDARARRLDDDTGAVTIVAEYLDEHTGNRRNVGLPYFVIDTTALNQAFESTPDTAVGALREALVNLLLHVRRNLHLLPVRVDRPVVT